MPPKKSKQKSFKSSSASQSTTVSTSEPPKPYGRPNPKIEPFLEKLSTRHVYITHIDTKPADFKYKIFSVPVMMNLFIIAGILWRIYHIGLWYMKICWSVSGKYNETTIDTYNIPVEETIKEILRRAAVFMIDLCIYVFIWPWPRDFWAGRRNGQFDNPVTWRYYTGFRNTEIVVRRSRKWDVIIKDPLDDEHEGTKELLANLHAAVDPMWMSEKTGYLMLNKWWDLDWNLMIEATKLVDEKKVPLDEFRTTIFVHTEDFGWVVIENSAARGTAKEEEGRLKIIAFKDELTAMGKENVFFRWIELVQFESSQPGGFGPERQAATMVKAKTMFEEQGIDFDAFWAKIDGMQGMPGLDYV